MTDRKCRDFRTRMDECAASSDGTILDHTLQQHLDECPSCRLAWRVHLEMLKTLEQERTPEVPIDFTAQVMEKLPKARLRNLLVNETFLVTSMMIASVIVILVWLYQSGIWQIQSRGKLVQQFNDIWNVVSLTTAAMISKMKTLITSAFGDQVFEQGWQIVLISVVTFLVAKGALAVETRVKRMLKQLKA